MADLENSKWSFSVSDALPLWRQSAEHIQGLINRGELKPGDPLPSHEELAQISGIGASTLQKALNWLSAEGLIVRHRRRGSFVADNADANRPAWIGVMTRAMFDPSISKWDMVGARALIDVLADEGVEFRFYHNRYLPTGADADSQDIATTLIEDVDAGRVRGLLVIGAIPANHPEFRKTLKSKCIPLVELTSRGRETQFVVEFDRAGFLRRALELAGERRCRSVGLIDSLGIDEQTPLKKAFDQQLVASELVTSSNWTISVDWPASTVKGFVAMQRLRAGSEQLPDALVITDEYVALGVAQACLAGGVRVPEDLLLISYFTEGADIAYPLPVMTIHFSPDQLMQQGWAMLKARIDGELIRQRSVRIPPSSTQLVSGYATACKTPSSHPQGAPI